MLRYAAIGFALLALNGGLEAQNNHFIDHRGHHELTHWSLDQSISRYFSFIYLKTDSLLQQQSIRSDSTTAAINLRFGIAFREAFLHAARAYQQHDSIPKEWAFYFSDSSRHPFTYWMLGVHAHILGDMPSILARTLSPQELLHHRRPFRRLNRIFDAQADWAIQQILGQQQRLYVWHRLSFGMDRILAKHIVHRWRAKAFRRAIRIHQHRAKFPRWEREFQRTNKQLASIGKRVFRT